MRSRDPGRSSGGPELRVAVVAVNYGSHELLRRYLRWAFAVPGYDGPDIVIVDNRRTEEDRVAITQLAREAGWHLVVTDVNLGFGAGVNLGAHAAWGRGADVIVVVNPDLEIARSDIDALVSAVAEDPQTLVAPSDRRSHGSTMGAPGSGGHAPDLRHAHGRRRRPAVGERGLSRDTSSPLGRRRRHGP